MGGGDIDLDTVVEFERGGIALGIESFFCRVLHVLSVGVSIEVEGSDGNADSSSGKCR